MSGRSLRQRAEMGYWLRCYEIAGRMINPFRWRWWKVWAALVLLGRLMLLITFVLFFPVTIPVVAYLQQRADRAAFEKESLYFKARVDRMQSRVQKR